MDITELEQINGKPENKPTCDSRLPVHYQPRSHDGHLGGVDSDDDYDPYDGNGLNRDHFGFYVNPRTLY